MTTTQQKDYYKVLGVKRGASSDEIRKVYRRLARKYHPDVNPGDQSAEDRFKSVQEAYDILSDEKKRKMYDQFGFYSDAGPYAGAGRGAGPGGFDFSGSIFPISVRVARPGRAEQPASRPGAGFPTCFRSFSGRVTPRAVLRPRPSRAKISSTPLTSDSGKRFAGQLFA